MRGIYKITNTINNKCYIGKSENLPDRIKYHIKSLLNGDNKNKHMQNAYKKYGENSFTVEIIEILNEEDDINDREKYWISFYNSNDKHYGYNRTAGGDGGNSYVDCMTEEEREEHYKKHIEIRTGENNINYGKHLYHLGLQQKYLSEDEINEYEANGWERGANAKIKQETSERYIGDKNPFYGKKHSEDTLKKIMETKIKNGISSKGYKRYYKDGIYKFISDDEVEMYESDGWTKTTTQETREKISETKRKHFNNPEWLEEFRKRNCLHYIYDNIDFYGEESLLKYLRENGYPTISKSTIKRFNKNLPTNKYNDLFNKLKLERKEK